MEKENLKVTMQDIRSIKIGTSVTFTVESPRDVQSVRNRAYFINVSEPELKKVFSCAADFKNRKITVTANPVK